MSTIKTNVVQIGNSCGICIPPPLLGQFTLGQEVELAVQPFELVIRSVRRPRQGWDEQFRLMAERGDDRLPGEAAVSLTEWDEDEWEWTQSSHTTRGAHRVG